MDFKLHTMTKITDQQIEYAVLIGGAMSQVLDEDSEFYVGEINDENITEFIHAMANMVPPMLYEQLTGDQKSSIDFNHIANKLCFQYSSSDK